MRLVYNVFGYVHAILTSYCPRCRNIEFEFVDQEISCHYNKFIGRYTEYIHYLNFECEKCGKFRLKKKPLRCVDLSDVSGGREYVEHYYLPNRVNREAIMECKHAN